LEVRFPMWLRAVDRPGARVFGTLNGIEAFSRALIVGVLPLEANVLFEDARSISMIYAIVGLVAFGSSFLLPLVLRRLRRKWVISIGFICMILAPSLLALATQTSFATALLFRGFAVVAVNISLNLYILDYIRKSEFVTFEPTRLMFLGVAWCIGPAAGIYLHSTFGLLSVLVLSACFAALALMFFWFLRIREHASVAPATYVASTPWQFVRRFLQQPRLRLAWIITFGRSAFWTTFFVYPPLYIMRNGGDAATVAIMISASQALLLIAPLFGKLGVRFGIRRVIILAATYSGCVVIIAGLADFGPTGTAVMFVLASLGAVALDALGNIPFLRAVHYFERSEMTAVFRTYIEASQLVTAFVYTAVLFVAPLPAVFVVLGVILLLCAWYARLLPRRF
jgi:MFS family permease